MTTDPERPPGPRQILLIRHAEKPDTGPDGMPAGPAVGVEEGGAPNPHSLTPRGWQRAGALAALLARAGGAEPQLTAPTVLLAPDYGEPALTTFHRTVQTITPLARRLQLPVRTSCAKGAERELVADHVWPAADECVLVCWEHQHLTDILDAMTSTADILPAPQLPANGWPDDRFDMILAFDRRPGPRRTYSFSQIPQMLLAGDSTTPICAERG